MTQKDKDFVEDTRDFAKEAQKSVVDFSLMLLICGVVPIVALAVTALEKTLLEGVFEVFQASLIALALLVVLRLLPTLVELVLRMKYRHRRRQQRA